MFYNSYNWFHIFFHVLPYFHVFIGYMYTCYLSPKLENGYSAHSPSSLQTIPVIHPVFGLASHMSPLVQDFYSALDLNTS